MKGTQTVVVFIVVFTVILICLLGVKLYSVLKEKFTKEEKE